MGNNDTPREAEKMNMITSSRMRVTARPARESIEEAEIFDKVGATPIPILDQNADRCSRRRRT